jgi:hypothetical protein
MLETGRDLMKEEMTRLNQVYSKYMNLRGNVKRMDSLMVASRCRRMSRLEIIYATTANIVKMLQRIRTNGFYEAFYKHESGVLTPKPFILFIIGRDSAIDR